MQTWRSPVTTLRQQESASVLGFGRPHERLLDLLLDLRRRHARLDGEQVADALDTRQPLHDALGVLLLELPFAVSIGIERIYELPPLDSVPLDSSSIETRRRKGTRLGLWTALDAA